MILYINSYNTKFIWETKRKWIVWIVRETLRVNEKKKKKNCRALHIDYTPFLGCLESFMTNLEKKIKKKKIKPCLKKKIGPYKL